MDKRGLTKQLRDKNIAVSEHREKPEEPDQITELGLTKEEIREKLQPKKKPAKKVERPFLILKDQERLLIEKDDTLVEALRKSYLKEAGYGSDGLKKKGDYKRTSLKFSHVYYCSREVYYEFFEPERARSYTVKGLILFEEGKRHHKNIQSRLDEEGVLRGSEGYLHIAEINANGFYDGLVPVEKNGNWQVCDLAEVKSKLPGACSSVAQKDYDQAQLYHIGAQQSPDLKARKIKVRNIRIFYRDRAIQTDEVDFGWLAKPDPERQKEIMEYMRFLWNKVVGEKFLSPHPYEKKSTKCTYCLYKDWCWREYPDQVEEWQPTEDLENVKLPAQEILESFARRLYEILKQEKDLREEKKKLEPILLKYFIETKSSIMPINQSDGIAPKQGSRTEWNIEGLRIALGDEYYSKISTPDAARVRELIHQEYVDAAKFEAFKTQKLNKPSLYIKKLQGGLDAD